MVKYNKHKEGNKEAQKMEKGYRAMKNRGGGSIAVGIIVLVVGVTAGVISIINGAGLLRHKKEIIF